MYISAGWKQNDKTFKGVSDLKLVGIIQITMQEVVKNYFLFSCLPKPSFSGKVLLPTANTQTVLTA